MKPRLLPSAAANHRRVVELVAKYCGIARVHAALPEFVAGRSAAQAAWLGWRSFAGDGLEQLERELAEQLTAQRDEALAAHGVDVRRRPPITTHGELAAALDEIKARDLGRWRSRRGPRPARQFGEWLSFLVASAELDVRALAELVRSAPSSWSPAPFEQRHVPAHGLEARIKSALARSTDSTAISGGTSFPLDRLENSFLDNQRERVHSSKRGASQRFDGSAGACVGASRSIFSRSPSRRIAAVSGVPMNLPDDAKYYLVRSQSLGAFPSSGRPAQRRTFRRGGIEFDGRDWTPIQLGTIDALDGPVKIVSPATFARIVAETKVHDLTAFERRYFKDRGEEARPVDPMLEIKTASAAEIRALVETLKSGDKQ